MFEENNLTIKVGIGASAGGIDAIQKLLNNLDNDNGFAYFIVMHLAPDKESNLTDIIRRTTTMPVTLAEDEIEIKENQVYIIPPNKKMSTRDDLLKIEPLDTENRPYLTINYFLESLAKESEEKAIGVILSGTGSDGTLGLRSIKEQGGITFAQSEGSAKYPQMPHQATLSGSVDFILTPEEIARELNRIGKDFLNVLKTRQDRLESTNRKIINLLRRSHEVDFSKYKPTSFNRRVRRRIILGGFSDIHDYYDHLVQNREDLNNLYHDLLINVTEFFRDPEAFQTLKKDYYPRIVQRNKEGKEIRVWVVGCSTGEEVYSITISLTEYIDEAGIAQQVKIFGTDVNPETVKAAKTGYYSESIAENVPNDRLRKFFIKKDAGYEVKKRIRDMCIFAEHDVTSDPPLSNMDMISCRNLLIYLDVDTQQQVITTFHYAIKPSGILFLGKSETVGSKTELFKIEDTKFKIYSKKYVPKPE